MGAESAEPDLTCNLLTDAKNINPVLVSPDPNDLNPSLKVQGDAAEGSIPRYLITFTDPSGTERVCRATADEQYPRTNPTSHAVAYRHRFRYSLAVLAECWWRSSPPSSPSCASATTIRSKDPQ